MGDSLASYLVIKISLTFNKFFLKGKLSKSGEKVIKEKVRKYVF